MAYSSGYARFALCRFILIAECLGLETILFLFVVSETFASFGDD
jgi:hypothetical protein